MVQIKALPHAESLSIQFVCDAFEYGSNAELGLKISALPLISNITRPSIFFWHIIRTDAALLIAWHGEIYFSRVRQIQSIHDVDEFVLSFVIAEAWIAYLFLCDGGDLSAFVIVCGVDVCFIRQAEKLVLNAVV